LISVAMVLWDPSTRPPDCLLQQGSPGTDKGGAMRAARFQLAPVLVVVAR
jgi:hypothetical protein